MTQQAIVRICKACWGFTAVAIAIVVVSTIQTERIVSRINSATNCVNEAYEFGQQAIYETDESRMRELWERRCDKLREANGYIREANSMWLHGYDTEECVIEEMESLSM